MMNLSLLIASLVLSPTQGHDLKPAEAMSQLSFLAGEWKGKQEFNTGGAPMVGDASDHVSSAVGGRYFEERLSTLLPGRAPTDTRHFIGYDPKTAKFKAWWFNDTSVGPMELEGTLSGKTLVLQSAAGGKSPVLKATYVGVSDHEMTFTLEMQMGADWQKLFTSTYKRG